MPPSNANQRRKRGGRPGALKTESDASRRDGPASTAKGRLEKANDATTADAVLKKRGRPRKSTDGNSESQERPTAQTTETANVGPSAMAAKGKGRPRKSLDSAPQEESLISKTADKSTEMERYAVEPKKRGRPRKSTDAQPSEIQEAAETRPRKRARGGKEGEADVETEEPSLQERQRKKARSDKGPATTNKPGAQNTNQPAETSSRRSTRDRRSADDNPWWAPNTGNDPPPKGANPKTREKPSGPAAKRPSNRPNTSSPSATAVPPKKARGRSSLAEVSSNTQRPISPPQLSKPNKPARKSTTTTPAEKAPSSQPPSKYRQLASRTRQIIRSAITSKWTPLNPPSIAAVTSIIQDATRPVLLRLTDRDNRHQQAQFILHRFATRLRTKLEKGMPFPPPTTTVPKKRGGDEVGGAGGHEADLDFERTVDAVQNLEKTLDPLLHSVQLLQKEKEREERALAREYKLLRDLGVNSRAQAREWKERDKREHVLVPGRGVQETSVDSQHGGTGPVVNTGEVVTGVFKDLQEEGEEELLALSQQIGSHMESMRSNLAQIEGVLPAIARGKAALQRVLGRRLDAGQYSQVVLE